MPEGVPQRGEPPSCPSAFHQRGLMLLLRDGRPPCPRMPELLDAIPAGGPAVAQHASPQANEQDDLTTELAVAGGPTVRIRLSPAASPKRTRSIMAAADANAAHVNPSSGRRYCLSSTSAVIPDDEGSLRGGGRVPISSATSTGCHKGSTNRQERMAGVRRVGLLKPGGDGRSRGPEGLH